MHLNKHINILSYYILPSCDYLYLAQCDLICVKRLKYLREEECAEALFERKRRLRLFER